MTTALQSLEQSLRANTAAIFQGQNLCDCLDYRAQQQPEQLAYQYLRRGETIERAITYHELQVQAQTIAFHLQAMRATGGRALLVFSPGLDFVATFLGCFYAGVTAVPAYPPRKNQRILRLQAIVENAEATVVLSTSELAQKIGKWFEASSPLSNIPWLSVDTLAPGESEVRATPNPIAFLQYTSGSTGAPKGVMVTQENLSHNLAAIYRCFGHSAESRGVIWLPPYHDMGLIGGVLQPLYGGFPVTLMSPVDFLQKPLRWLQAISQHSATTSGGPDFAYRLCVDKLESLRNRDRNLEPLKKLDLSSWQVAFTGAEPVRTDTLDRFAEAFEPYGFRREAFYPCYGMAETTLIAAGGAVDLLPVVETIDAQQLSQHRVERVVQEQTGESDESACTVVGCGKSLVDQKIVIVHPKRLTRCAPTEVGEIWVAGKSVAQGYWSSPQETVRCFHAYLKESDLAGASEGPFLRTGDLGFVHNGELFVTGRIKDMMIIRGRNHYPQDIEHVLESCHLALKAGASAAFSIEHEGNEQLVVVCEVKRTYLRQLDIKSVSREIRQVIAAAYDLQTYATFLVKPGSIPKTSSGKIQRYRCRELFLKGDLAVVEDWSENPKYKREFVKIQSEVDKLFQIMSAEK